MKILSVLLYLFCLPLFSFAQFTATFTDGDLTHLPKWVGDTSMFKVKDGKLNSNYTAKSGDPMAHFSLATSSKKVTATAWEFWVKTKTTSKNNFIRIFLSSQRKIPRKDSVDYGYYIEIGNTPDEVVLKKKDSLKHTLLIQGPQGVTESAAMKIKVICTQSREWQLYIDFSGSGNQYQLEGIARDSSFTKSKYFSIEIFQKGKTTNHSHWFDDISVQKYLPDTLPPILQQSATKDAHHLILFFSESLLQNQLTSPHFLFNHHPPDSVTFLPNSSSKILLSFSDTLSLGKSYSLQINGLSDLFGNTLDTIIYTIIQAPKKWDVVISEIYPDPKNSNGLPEEEFIELYNNSSEALYLGNWEICDKVRCAVFPPIILEKGQALIVCDEKNESLFSLYGKTIGLPRFPTLNNGEEKLYLKNERGQIIHQVHYTKDSYQNKDKSNGGWSLEMQFPQNPCLTTGNWAASESLIGGSPGKISPNFLNNTPSLEILNFTVLDSVHLQLQFNALLDRQTLSKAIFRLEDKILQEIKSDSISNDVLYFTLPKALEKSTFYTLKILELKSCGLQMRGEASLSFALPEKPVPGDLFFNEILFNPKKRGAEFIEIYNASQKIIDLQKLFLANKRNHEYYQSYPVSSTSYFLLPQEYVALTKDQAYLLRQYFPKFPEHILEIERLPSYPNLEGNAFLLDEEGILLDHFYYSEKDQSSFIHSPKGVSLEKAFPTLSSADLQHWHSASSLYHYGTPGYRNSQYQPNPESRLFRLEIRPETFSPDGDGRDDFSLLKYDIPPGYSSKIVIYDAKGIPVRHLIDNKFLGTKGKIRWNGKNDKHQMLSTGVYIFFIQLYHPSGSTHIYKLPVVLVKRS